MELQIIGVGFKCSMEDYGVKYKYVIGDYVYVRLLKKVPIKLEIVRKNFRSWLGG